MMREIHFASVGYPVIVFGRTLPAVSRASIERSSHCVSCTRPAVSRTPRENFLSISSAASLVAASVCPRTWTRTRWSRGRPIPRSPSLLASHAWASPCHGRTGQVGDVGVDGIDGNIAAGANLNDGEFAWPHEFVDGGPAQRQCQRCFVDREQARGDHPDGLGIRRAGERVSSSARAAISLRSRAARRPGRRIGRR